MDLCSPAKKYYTKNQLGVKSDLLPTLEFEFPCIVERSKSRIDTNQELIRNDRSKPTLAELVSSFFTKSPSDYQAH